MHITLGCAVRSLHIWQLCLKAKQKRSHAPPRAPRRGVSPPPPITCFQQSPGYIPN